MEVLGKHVNKGIFDTTLTKLKFPYGIKAHIFVSWLYPYKEQKLVVVDSKAMAVFDDISKEKLVLYSHIIKLVDGKMPVASKAKGIPIEVEKKEPLREELQHFAKCIENRTIPKTSGEEGLKVLRALQLA